MTIELLLKLVFYHLIGDYVLQTGMMIKLVASAICGWVFGRSVAYLLMVR